MPEHDRQITEQRGERRADIDNEKLHGSPQAVCQEPRSLGMTSVGDSPQRRYRTDEIRESRSYLIGGVPAERRKLPSHDIYSRRALLSSQASSCPELSNGYAPATLDRVLCDLRQGTHRRREVASH
jgi:hypothetical protein